MFICLYAYLFYRCYQNTKGAWPPSNTSKARWPIVFFLWETLTPSFRSHSTVVGARVFNAMLKVQICWTSTLLPLTFQHWCSVFSVNSWQIILCYGSCGLQHIAQIQKLIILDEASRQAQGKLFSGGYVWRGYAKHDSLFGMATDKIEKICGLTFMGIWIVQPYPSGGNY